MSDDELLRWNSAWQWIVCNLHNSEWTPIPDWVRDGCNLSPRIHAVCNGGFFQTPTPIRGMREFIDRLNAVKEK